MRLMAELGGVGGWRRVGGRWWGEGCQSVSPRRVAACGGHIHVKSIHFQMLRKWNSCTSHLCQVRIRTKTIQLSHSLTRPAPHYPLLRVTAQTPMMKTPNTNCYRMTSPDTNLSPKTKKTKPTQKYAAIKPKSNHRLLISITINVS